MAERSRRSKYMETALARRADALAVITAIGDTGEPMPPASDLELHGEVDAEVISAVAAARGLREEFDAALLESKQELEECQAASLAPNVQ
jgi:hypothetical protein